MGVFDAVVVPTVLRTALFVLLGLNVLRAVLVVAVVVVVVPAVRLGLKARRVVDGFAVREDETLLVPSSLEVEVVGVVEPFRLGLEARRVDDVAKRPVRDDETLLVSSPSPPVVIVVVVGPVRFGLKALRVDDVADFPVRDEETRLASSSLPVRLGLKGRVRSALRIGESPRDRAAALPELVMKLAVPTDEPLLFDTVELLGSTRPSPRLGLNALRLDGASVLDVFSFVSSSLFLESTCSPSSPILGHKRSFAF